MSVRLAIGKAYPRIKHYDNEVALLEDVPRTQRRLLGSSHPEPLFTMHELANSYDCIPEKQKEGAKLMEETLAKRD
jgi:hypothetical protein